MNYLDLFSGIGGFAGGIERAGTKFSKHYFSEIDKYASSVYKRHFPDAIELGDISNITGEGLGQIDLITFGFPCQDLSIAGNRAGLSGSRSGLFHEAIRLIRRLKPQVFVFENVKGLFSSGGGRDFVEVLRTIADIGLYECEWQLCNTTWVLPQNRERIYFIGHLAGRSGRKVFPFRSINETDNELSGQERIANSLRRGNNKDQESFIIESQQFAQAYRVRDTERDAVALQGEAGGCGAKTGLYAQGQRIRRLTPTECERLQGFPDGWTEYGHDGKKISDNQRYKMLGNAVSVPIVQMIFERLLTPTDKEVFIDG